MEPRKVCLILYYSRYGAVERMARCVEQGSDCVSGVDVMVRTVPPVFSIHEQPSHPLNMLEPSAPYVTLDDLSNCDGLALGSPTRFGNMAAPLKYFWDQTGEIWMSGELIGKPATLFTSAAHVHGGQESTLLSMMLPLFHHGMLIFGTPSAGISNVFDRELVNPYGASHTAGEQSDQVIAPEVKIFCRTLGERLARLVLKFGGSSV